MAAGNPAARSNGNQNPSLSPIPPLSVAYRARPGAGTCGEQQQLTQLPALRTQQLREMGTARCQHHLKAIRAEPRAKPPPNYLPDLITAGTARRCSIQAQRAPWFCRPLFPKPDLSLCKGAQMPQLHASPKRRGGLQTPSGAQMGTRRRLPLPTHDPPPPRAPPHPAGGQRGNPEQKRRRSAARHPRSDAGPLPGSALSRRPPPRAAGPAPLPPPHRPAGSAPLRSAGGEGRGLGRHGAARSRLRFRFRSGSGRERRREGERQGEGRREGWREGGRPRSAPGKGRFPLRQPHPSRPLPAATASLDRRIENPDFCCYYVINFRAFPPSGTQRRSHPHGVTARPSGSRRLALFPQISGSFLPNTFSPSAVPVLGSPGRSSGPNALLVQHWMDTHGRVPLR